MATIEQGVGSGVSFALSEEQKGLRELAREFAEKEIRPKAAEYDEHQTHPADVIAKAHELGLMNLHVPESLGGLGLSTFDGILVGEELNWGCSGHRHVDRGERPRLRPGDHRRQRGAAGEVAAAAARRADSLLLRPLGARGRLRRRQPEDDRRASRRRVRPERVEDVHLERRPRRLDGRLREDGSGQGPQGDVRVHRPDGHAGRPDGEAPRQDGPALDRHLGVRAHRRRRSGCEPPRRGGRGLQDRDADARLHAPRHRRRRRRRRPGRLRVRGRVRQAARHLRRPDRDAPGRSAS